MKKLTLLLSVFLLVGCSKDNKSTLQLTSPIATTISETPFVVYDTTQVIQQSNPVDLSYFDDVAFVGDSRTVGISTYGILENTHVIASASLSVKELDIKKVIKEDGEMKTVMEALEGNDYHAIYINFGINELGYSFPNIFIEQYVKSIEKIKESHPHSPIIVQTLFHISEHSENKHHSYLNNSRIDEFNELITQMAKEHHYLLLDTRPAVEDENGFLISDYTEDGIHLNKKGYTTWLNYITTHTMEGNIKK